MSSVLQAIPWTGHANRAASKGGILLTMRSSTQDFAEKQIGFNANAPDAIGIGINKDVWSDLTKFETSTRRIPYGRIGELEVVAGAAAWPASDEWDYLTGTTLSVDGGMVLYPEFCDDG